MAPPDPTASSDDTRACPLCGETIKKVAIRCKHCHGDLSTSAESPPPDFDRAARPSAKVVAAQAGSSLVAQRALSDEEFEQRFLDYAYRATEPITAISVAYALKIPIALADDRLEHLAASDILRRDVDDEGGTYFSLPGKRSRGDAALAHAGPPTQPIHPPPSEAAATAGLVLNLFMPGIGSIVSGKARAGVAQLALILVGLPLCFAYIGFPMIFAAWIWGLVTSGNALHESRLSDVPVVGRQLPLEAQHAQLPEQGSDRT